MKSNFNLDNIQRAREKEKQDQNQIIKNHINERVLNEEKLENEYYFNYKNGAVEERGNNFTITKKNSYPNRSNSPGVSSLNHRT